MIIIERFSNVNRVARCFRKIRIRHRDIGLFWPQVRAHLVHALKIGMAVDVTRAHQSHDPCLDRVLGFSHSLLGQALSFRHMRHLFSRLLENVSTIVNITVTLTNLIHHSGHAKTPPHRVCQKQHVSPGFQMSTGQDERQRLRPCEVSHPCLPK